ncbi:hypothetical protein [Mucilaginibacter phyllosphaerae]|uniref:Sensor of ECF-type sigma factor n=1 Tax=Mucilaginibacter phyllosphaerae TaxID=1812349 RepID=A0A4Y8AK33_9SPHI|nr:hypothetical protein [Mucilaginibacter phyllosphaerae]MBB3967554.1 hypothetical protein [Mucilaginibacter phyllosphaerae]TEW69386.1 hypothetical protein E2R65_04240 [Mucilaginibacter phyllosphaerae]GGH21372.1 hypothetical protein GCM10007352_34040 [Mucilaginibacter phyllosphaerae]
MNRLFRYIFFLLVFAISDNDVFAQINNLRRPVPSVKNRIVRNPKLQAARDKFIGQQLALTDEESRRFWPLYRQYQQELTAVKILKRLNNSSSTANGMDQIDKELEYDNQMVVIRKRYRDEFLKVLPPEKVSALYKSEVEFTNELIKQFSERSIRAGN